MSGDALFVVSTMFVVFIGLAGAMILAGWVIVDQTLSLIIGSALILICIFGFAGYSVGRERGREIEREEKKNN